MTNASSILYQAGAEIQNAQEKSANNGPIVYDEYGNKYTLTEPIGEGGQGAVFRVNQGAGKDLAIKIQRDGTGGILADEKVYLRTARMVRRIMAMPIIDRIALPIAMLEKPYCGYVMRFMDRLKPIKEYMIPHSTKGQAFLKEYFEEHGGYAKRINMLSSFASVLMQLHAIGVVYGDISPTNVFISEEDDDHQAWLIDVDNLKYEYGNDTCIGTPTYMAPEVFNGQHNTMASDCYSFALIAFECLTMSKPFCGSITNEEPDEDFGACPEDLMNSGEISYIYEGDPRNEPMFALQRFPEYVMTAELQDLFMQTFCKEGRAKPETRPKMTDWVRALTNACASLVTCKAKHKHIGNSCLLCRTGGISNDTNPCYVLRTFRVSTIYAPLRDTGCEEDESLEVDPYETLIECPNKFLRFAYANGKKELRIQIPYRMISSARPVRRPEDTLFEIVYSNGEITTGRTSDSRLKILSKSSSASKSPDGSIVRISYNKDRKFEFRIAREKQ